MFFWGCVFGNANSVGTYLRVAWRRGLHRSQRCKQCYSNKNVHIVTARISTITFTINTTTVLLMLAHRVLRMLPGFLRCVRAAQWAERNRRSISRDFPEWWSQSSAIVFLAEHRKAFTRVPLWWPCGESEWFIDAMSDWYQVIDGLCHVAAPMNKHMLH